MEDLNEFVIKGGLVTPELIRGMQKGLTLAYVLAQTKPVRVPQPSPVPPKSPLMIAAIQAQQQQPRARPQFNNKGELVGTGECIELFYIETESLPTSVNGMPRYIVSEFQLAVNREADPTMQMTLPGALYATREAAQAAITDLLRKTLRRNVGEFLERLILCGLEQGVCDQPETDLAEHLQQYLAAIKPGNQPIEDPAP